MTRSRGRPKISPKVSIGSLENSATTTEHDESVPHTHESVDTPEPKKERKPRQSRQTASTEDMERIEGMLRSFATMAVGLTAQVSKNDAIVIAKHTILMPPVVEEHTPNLITATMQLAEHDRKVRTYLAGLAQQSAYLNVAVAGSAIVLGIMANHNLLPPMFNPVPVNPNDQQVSNGTHVMA